MYIPYSIMQLPSGLAGKSLSTTESHGAPPVRRTKQLHSSGGGSSSCGGSRRRWGWRGSRCATQWRASGSAAFAAPAPLPSHGRQVAGPAPIQRPVLVHEVREDVLHAPRPRGALPPDTPRQEALRLRAVQQDLRPRGQPQPAQVCGEFNRNKGGSGWSGLVTLKINLFFCQIWSDFVWI